MPQIYQNEEGKVIQVNTGMDITGAAATLIVKKPNASVVNWTCAVDADGAGATYVSQPSDFALAGTYFMQLKVITAGSAQTLYSNTFSVTVQASLG